jgi:hypothetical protein
MNCHPDRSEAKWRDLLFASITDVFFGLHVTIAVLLSPCLFTPGYD